MNRLSGTQRGLWLAERAGGRQHIVCSALRLQGKLDRVALLRAVDTVVARHDALRGRILEQDNDACWEFATTIRSPLHQVDATALAETSGHREERVLQQLALQRFELDVAPLMRVCLILCDPNTAVLWIAAHHLILDEASMQVLCAELLSVYQGIPIRGEPGSFTSYLTWLEAQRRGASGKLAQDYWRGRLAGLQRSAWPAVLVLYSSLTTQEAAIGGTARRHLPASDLDYVDELCRQYRCTRFVVLLGLMQILLKRYSAGTGLPICIPVRLRPEDDDRALVGSCVSVCVVRSECREEQALPELFAVLQEQVYAAWEHRFISLSETLDLSGCSHESRQEILRFWFSVQTEPAEISSSEFGALRIERCEVANPVPGSDFVLLARQDGQGWELVVEFNQAVFPAQCIDAMLSQYLRLIRSLWEAPRRRLSEVSLVSTPPAAAATRAPAESRVVDANLKPLPPWALGQIGTGTRELRLTGALGFATPDGVLQRLDQPGNGGGLERGIRNPVLTGPASSAPAVRPRSALEIGVARAWSKVIGRPMDDLDVNFFDAGGNSVLAPLLAVRLGEEGLEVSIKDIYRYTTIRQQALAFAPAHQSRGECSTLKRVVSNGSPPDSDASSTHFR